MVRRDYCMMDILNKSTTIILWKVDYLVTARVLKMKMCLIKWYWISVHRFKSCTMKALESLQLVRRDYCMMDILNESTTYYPLKSRLSLHSVVLKMKMCLISGYWIQYIDSSLAQWKHRNDFIWFAVTMYLDILNESTTIIPWKVDYLFTAVVLKMKMCLINRYWISVHRFKSCTMKASEWLQLVRRDYCMMDILNKSTTIILWKVDYLFTAVVLKMKMCLIKLILNFSTSIQVLHNESIFMTSAGSPWLLYDGYIE